MRNKRNIVCWIGLLLLMPMMGWAQGKKPDIDLDAFILELFPNQKEENQIENYEDIYESLYQFYLNPLDLNKADRSDLQALFILSEQQINSFLTYRSKQGRLLSLYELQSVPDFEDNTIRKVLPFVSVDEKGLQQDNRSLWRRILEEKDNHYMILRYNQILETKKGYTNPDTSSTGELSQRYAGSPDQTYFRYRISHPKDFSIGLTIEKDPGELYNWNPARQQYGMDFISFHAYFENVGRFKKIVVGDYQIGVGQNVLLTAGFTLGKGAEPIATIRRSHWGIRPYTSVLETGFMRGGAATYSLTKRLDLTGFYSLARRDANVLEQPLAIDTLNKEATGDLDDIPPELAQQVTENFIETIRATGLHRTPTELSARNTLREQTWGAHLLYTNLKQTLQIGATWLAIGYEVPLRRVDRIYNRFEFNGKNSTNYGLHFSYNWQNFNFFGEFAQSESGGIGAVGGFVSSLAPTVDFAMLYRRYDKNFHSFYGSSFSENARNINETGWYWGIKIRPVKKVELSAYYDWFSFPYLRFAADAPSEGYEYLARIAYKPTKKIQIFFQYREESKAFNQKNSNSVIDFLNDRLTNNYLFNIDYRAEKTFSFKTRFQLNTVRQGGLWSEGYLVFQDIGIDIGKWKVDTRFALFNDDLNRLDEDTYGGTLLYVYEKNVLWAPTLVRYSGQGTRWMLMCRYKLNRNIDFWVRFAQTYRLDAPQIGTGLEQINGNVISQLTTQLKINF